MMTSSYDIQRKGTEAVKKLRLKKLHAGHTFMINSKELPHNQCYLEYPEGFIKLVTLSSDVKAFEIIRVLSSREASSIKRRFNLA